MVWSSASSTLIGPLVFAFVIWYSPNTQPLRFRWWVWKGIVASTPFRARVVSLYFDYVVDIPTVLPASSSAIHRSAWKRNSQKFGSRSGHLAYMLCSVPLLRSDSQAGHPLDLPLPRAARLSCLPASAVLGHLGQDYAELRLLGILRSPHSPGPAPVRGGVSSLGVRKVRWDCRRGPQAGSACRLCRRRSRCASAPPCRATPRPRW